MVGWFVVLLIAVAVQAVAYVLRPKVKQAKPEPAKSLDDPVAEAGLPIPVIFGTIRRTELNVLWYGDKSAKTYKVKV